MDKRPRMDPRRCHRGVWGLSLTLAALPAAAQVSPLTYQNVFFDQATNAHPGNYLAVDAGLFYTDNATYVSNGSGDTLAEVGLIGNTSQVGPTLDYRIDSDIAALKYLHDTYPLEPTGYFDASADLKIVPGAFTWVARETYSELVIDPYAPVTPDNLEGLNTIATGPRFTLRPTLRTTVTLQGIYSYVDSHSPSPLYVNIDNHRYGGSLRIERAFSSAASLYLKGAYEKVDFNDQAINNNFSVADGVVGYKYRGARTWLDVSAGYTALREFNVLVPVESIVGTVERPTTRTDNAPNWAVDLSRVMTPAQRIALFGSQQLVDAATLFQLNFEQAVPSLTPPQLAVGDPVTNRVYGLDWRFQALRTALDVALLDERQRFELDPSLNRQLRDAAALLARQLSPVLNWDIGLHYDHESLSAARSFNATSAITSLRWHVGSRLALRFMYAHTRFEGINDNQVGVTVSYVLIGGGVPGPAFFQGGGAAEETQPPALSPVAPMSTLPQPH